MLADELDSCKEQGNTYVDENIREIQELYREKEEKLRKEEKEKGIQDEEVFLYKPYKALT